MAYRPTQSSYEISDDPAQGGVAITSGNVLAVLQATLSQGELELAVRLYEESGRGVAEQLLNALKRALPAQRTLGARMFAQARDFARAARLYESAKEWPEAAKLYEEAGDSASAGNCHERAGNLQAAAQAYDAAGLVDKAVPLFEELGDKASMADCYMRGQRPFAAAKIYRELKNLRGETEALRQVPNDAQEKPAAAKRLAELLLARNRISEATHVLADALRDNEAARKDLELNERLLALFEKQGLVAHIERMRSRLARLKGASDAPKAPPRSAPSPGSPTVEVAEMLSTYVPNMPAKPAPEPQVKSPLDTDPAAELASLPEEGYAFLKNIPLFGRLPLSDMKDLYRATSEVTFKPGEILIEVGVEGPGLLIIVEGTAEVLALGLTGARHLNSLSAGDFLGEISLVSRALTSARVVASTFVRALAIDRPRFDHFLYAHPSASVRVYRLFAERLAERVRALSLPES